jgi:hypothetical protein
LHEKLARRETRRQPAIEQSHAHFATAHKKEALASEQIF